MGYYLKLQDPAVPEFLAMNGFDHVPPLLALLKSPFVAFPLVILLPALVALVIGWPTFRSGIKGVYFTILSQALALAFYLLFINQQQFTGGTSGIYNYTAFMGLRASQPQILYPMYFITAGFLIGAVFFVKALLGTRTGKVVMAIKNGENRLKFLGYNPVSYKVFVFVLSAGIAGLGGALYAIQVGSVYPTYLSINYSIMMVIWVGAGGLGTTWGPVIGAVLLNAAGTLFSENFPDLWWFVLGSILIGIVFLFRGGIVALKGKLEAAVSRLWRARAGKRERSGS
jgi:urea transport system permease protein